MEKTKLIKPVSIISPAMLNLSATIFHYLSLSKSGITFMYHGQAVKQSQLGETRDANQIHIITRGEDIDCLTKPKSQP